MPTRVGKKGLIWLRLLGNILFGIGKYFRYLMMHIFILIVILMNILRLKKNMTLYEVYHD